MTDKEIQGEGVKRKRGKAGRIYSVNKGKLKEALEAIDEMVKPIKEKINAKDI